VILHSGENRENLWQGVSLKPVAGVPIFRITPPPYITPEITEFVRCGVQRIANN
jgi:hypothetical protein